VEDQKRSANGQNDAIDPTQTSSLIGISARLSAFSHSRLGRKVLSFRNCARAWSLWGAHATAEIHQADGRRGGSMAARGTSAVVSDAGGWVPRHQGIWR
jgi:hypothetical protein